MMKKLYGIGVIAVLATFWYVDSATAGAVNKLYADGTTINKLEDEDWEALVDTDGDGVVDPGELIFGVAKIQKIGDAFPGVKPDIDLQTAPDTFTAVFLLTTLTSTGDGIVNGVVDTLTFAPAPGAAWAALFGAAPVSAGTMAVMFDGVPFATANGASAATIAASIASFITGATPLWEFGFTSGVDANGDGLVDAGAFEFWKTRGEDADIVALTPTTTPTNRLSLNVTHSYPGVGGLVLLPHNYLGAVAGDTNFTGPAQLQGKGDFQDAGASSPWPIGTDTDFFLRPVPEPSSLALFGLAFGGMSIVRSIRRRKGQVS